MGHLQAVSVLFGLWFPLPVRGEIVYNSSNKINFLNTIQIFKCSKNNRKYQLHIQEDKKIEKLHTNRIN
jgi:hypothetical protein